jgi:hypothetical protein
MLNELVSEIRLFIESEKNGEVAAFVAVLEASLDSLVQTSDWVRQSAAENPNEVGAASVPYLELLTLILYCYMWARMVKVASQALASGATETDFYQAKIHVGCYFLDRLMPRYKSLVEEIRAGSDVLMSMDAALF